MSRGFPMPTATTVRSAMSFSSTSSRRLSRTISAVDRLAAILVVASSLAALPAMGAAARQARGSSTSCARRTRRAPRPALALFLGALGLYVAIGLLSAFVATRALSGLLYGVAAVDLPTFAPMAALMIVIGGLAAYVPAHRASRVDPCESLRSD